MISYEEYHKLVDNQQMIDYIKSFREMGDLHSVDNKPPEEDVKKHVEYVAKDQESFIRFLLLCDRLDRRDKAFLNLTVYHTILVTGPPEYRNHKQYIELFNDSIKEDGPIQDILKTSLTYESKDKQEGKLTTI